jgi:hypothetical protein
MSFHRKVEQFRVVYRKLGQHGGQEIRNGATAEAFHLVCLRVHAEAAQSVLHDVTPSLQTRFSRRLVQRIDEPYSGRNLGLFKRIATSMER